ncbi:MAG TPA: DNA polymerase III subunit gamma/tau [Blastocatellia bacterium]|jgi:DNA polymerase-3 subunit gamma/tau|nr:DNA polymerase III subunit gamma/tau [Blastocatellia bacterium]
MSDSQVIARRFRPKTFEQVVGQEAITRTLSNALTTGRLHHAYLFTGARGVGKTTTARIFAKALNCVNGVTTQPCDVCASCREIATSSSIDVLEIDAASNTGVDNVREVIINSISIAPARDRYKIFIIDEVHMLSTAAFNALLKTLEEPPPRVVFIMATTELQKVPETILSRCQVFEFRTISLRKIRDQLRHIAEDLGIQISETALLSIARAGEGSMRDAESALDQVISFAGQTVSDEDVSAALGLVDIETLNNTVRAIAEQDSQRVLRIIDEVVSRGYDLRNFCREMIVHTRALLVVKVAGFDTELVQMPQSEGEPLTRLADSFSEQDLVRFFSILTKTEQDIRTSSQPRFQLEIGLMKLVHARRLYLLEDALSRIAELQARLGGAGSPAAGSGSPPTPGPRAGKSGFPTGGPRPVSRVAQEVVARPPTFAAEPVSPAPPRSNVRETDSGAGRRPAQAVGDGDAASVPPSFKNPTGTDVAPRADSAASQANTLPPPPEPPLMLDDPFNYEPELPPVRANSTPASTDGEAAVKRIKDALEAKRKMMIVMALDKADVKIDGEFLRVSLSPDNVRDKIQLEGREKRQAIEEACREVLGRRLTLSVSVGGQAQADGGTKGKEGAKAKEKVVTNPKLKTLTDIFPPESIEIIKREP